jgi:hypothetical protein
MGSSNKLKEKQTKWKTNWMKKNRVVKRISSSDFISTPIEVWSSMYLWWYVSFTVLLLMRTDFLSLSFSILFEGL